MAFTYNIKQNTVDSHQTSPGCVLTFIRRENRLPKYYKHVDPKTSKKPLVVDNDCVEVSVTRSKGGVTKSMTAVLLSGEINYSTAVHSGDFVFVNILNWAEGTDNTVTCQTVAKKAANLRPINEFNDGFKGFFKIQSVREQLIRQPDGKLRLYYTIIAHAFTEFNNIMYFNQYMLEPNAPNNQFLFIQRLNSSFSSVVSKQNVLNLQKIMSLLYKSCLGEGISQEGRFSKAGILKSGNDQFLIPYQIGRLLGLISGQTPLKVADTYNFLMGIQQYTSNSSGSTSLSKGFNPIVNNSDGRIYETPYNVEGASLLQAEYWNQKQVWSIFKQYTNEVVNELYTCFRVSPDNDRVMPTVVFRQKPFTNEDYLNRFKMAENKTEDGTDTVVTKFLSLPRWKISPEMVLSSNLGCDEAARINFVQVFGRKTLLNDDQAINSNISQQIASGNYDYDIDDIVMNGLRPLIVTSDFDFVLSKEGNVKDHRAIKWTKLLADWVFGGHLKQTGTINCVGIQDPIAEGDNLEFNGNVYHIENITDTFTQAAEGNRSFRTTIAVSNGISKESDENFTIYPNMEFSESYPLKLDDSKNNQILPGYSDTQDGSNRDKGEIDTQKEKFTKSYSPPRRSSKTSIKNPKGAK